MKLGICCVYFYAPDSAWLLELQLRYIAATLQGYDYTIYAGANRLEEQLKQTLAGAPNVEVVRLPYFYGIANAEHAFYLDGLLRRAAEDGCTHLATLDSDSFPVMGDWPRMLLERMAGSRVAAVLRSENRDTHLPHPCGLFMLRSFLIERNPMMLPERGEIADFLKETKQRYDTGVGYGYALWKANEPWLKLERTNHVNPRSLLAGVYGDVLFHLGASSRRPQFSIDYQTWPTLRLVMLLRGRPLVWRVADFFDDRYARSNEAVLKDIVAELKSGPDSYISYLRTGKRSFIENCVSE